MVTRGIRQFTKRNSEGALVLWASNFHGAVDHTTEYFFCCWPRHLAFAIRADPQHHVFATVKPSEFHITEVKSYATGHWRLNFGLAEANVKFAERIVDDIVGLDEVMKGRSWPWHWNNWSEFIYGECMTQSVTVYDILQGIRSFVSCYRSTCKHIASAGGVCPLKGKR